MNNRVRAFKTDLQQIAWEELQTGIALQLERTPGEYDAPALIDSTANFIKRQYGCDYGKVADYLEARYEANDKQ